MFSFLKKVRLTRSTWFSLVLVILLLLAIVTTQYAALTSRDTRSKAAGPANPYVVFVGCLTNTKPYVLLAWNQSGNDDYWVDVVTSALYNSSWTNFWNRYTGATESLSWDNNNPFNPFAGSASGLLYADNNSTYYWRVWDGVQHSYPDNPFITTGDCRPDLTSINLATNGTLQAGNSLTFSGTIKEQASRYSPASNARFRLDVDNNGSWDYTLGTYAVPGLNGQGSYNLTSLSWSATQGTHKFELCADYTGAVDETNEGNNCPTKTFTVSSSYSQSSYYSQGSYGSVDLTVSSLSLSTTTPSVGQTVTATINVSNIGTVNAGSFWVDLYANQPGPVTCVNPNGQSSRQFPSLAAGASTGNFNLTFNAPSIPGNYVARVFADSDCTISEANESNNQQLTVAYTVSNPAPGYSQASYPSQGSYTTYSQGSYGGGRSTSLPRVVPPGSSAPSATNNDITLTFAENPFLKGGMEMTISVEGTTLSQKAVVEAKGGILVIKSDGKLVKDRTYVLKASSKNSLVQSVPFTFTNDTKVSVKAFVMGDFNTDNLINEVDLTKMVPNGMVEESNLYDLNYDGLVNSIDYSILLTNLGKKG